MSIRQDNQERVLAYQAATTLTYKEMEEIAGGSAGGYLTFYTSVQAGKASGEVGHASIDTKWDI